MADGDFQSVVAREITVQNNVASSHGMVIDMDASVGVNNTTGALVILNSGNSGNALSIYMNRSTSTGRLIRAVQDHASASFDCVELINDGTGNVIKIDQNGAKTSIEIDQDCSSASDIYAMKIANDNAGAGAAGGIDLSSFSADEPLLKVPADAVSSPGTLTHQIAVDVGGTTFYVYAYTTGS